MIQAVVDTNIVVSALLFRGLPLEVVEAALNGRFLWVTSPALRREAFQVLRSEKFGLSPAEVRSLTNWTFSKTKTVLPREAIQLITRRPQDNRVLECAVEGNCDYIITGDRKDLLKLETYQGIEIVTARKFLELLP